MTYWVCLMSINSPAFPFGASSILPLYRSPKRRFIAIRLPSGWQSWARFTPPLTLPLPTAWMKLNATAGARWFERKHFAYFLLSFIDRLRPESLTYYVIAIAALFTSIVYWREIEKMGSHAWWGNDRSARASHVFSSMIFSPCYTRHARQEFWLGLYHYPPPATSPQRRMRLDKIGRDESIKAFSTHECYKIFPQQRRHSASRHILY